MYFESHIKKCPVSCKKCNSLSNYEDFKDHKCETENENQETPRVKEQVINEIRNRNEKSPLEKHEQILLKSLIKRHEKSDGTLTIATRGQPQKYVRIINPRKKSKDASEKVVRKRSHSLSQVRKNIAGNDSLSAEKQQGNELKYCKKTSKDEICKTACVTGNIKIPASYSLTMKSEIGLNFSELRRAKRCLKPLGIHFENEQKERNLREDIIKDRFTSEFLENSDDENENSEYPLVYISELCNFVFEHLDTLNREGLFNTRDLTLPTDEI